MKQRLRSWQGKIHAWDGERTACGVFRGADTLSLRGARPVTAHQPITCNKCIRVLNRRAMRSLAAVTGALRRAGRL